MKRTILIGTALALFAVTTVAPAHGSSKKARKWPAKTSQRAILVRMKKRERPYRERALRLSTRS